MRIKAAILRELNKPLSIEEVDLPDVGHAQVKVRLKVSGICRKQFQEVRGLHGPDPYLPHLLGHEAAGIVEEVGPGVTRVSVGDHVVVSWIKAKTGLDTGHPLFQQNGRRINAGSVVTFNQYTVVAENRVTRIPKELPFDKAALLGCAIPTGVGVVLNTAKVKPESTVAIFGIGGVGLNMIQGAVLSEASQIIAIDLYDQKLESAKRFGATVLINARREDPVARIKELTKGGVDYAFEASASRQGMENAYASVRWGTGLAILAGNLPYGDNKILINPFPLYAGTRLIGTWGGETDLDRDIPRYVDWYWNGRLKIDELITHRFRLEDVNDAFPALERGEIGRAILEF